MIEHSFNQFTAVSSFPPVLIALHEGRGELHWRKGNAHSIEKRWLDARKIYQIALDILRRAKLSKQHLKVLQDFIKVCRLLGDEKTAARALNRGIVELERLLLNDPSEDSKIQLARQFSSFYQFRVDKLAQSLAPEEQITALEWAEERKNLCLRWLRYNQWIKADPESPKYSDIQKLLNPSTAAIYWHVSPTAITTFIVKHYKPPEVLILTAEETETDATDAVATVSQLQMFENWLAAWKKDYQNSWKLTVEKTEDMKEDTKQANKKELWQQELPKRLDELKKILKISAIESLLSEIYQLILIPHRDLHLLPLHVLFSSHLTITYLPSAHIGLTLQGLSSSSSRQLLSIEDPEAIESLYQETFLPKLLFAEIESAVISWLYPEPKRLQGQGATRTALDLALEACPGILHFTGHGYHNLGQPLESALVLAGEDLLTLRDICQLGFRSPHLICLSACETGITGNWACSKKVDS